MSMLARLANLGGASAATYLEDVFSTYLYTGNGSTQTITNGLDLSTKGGLVWTKCRDTASTAHRLYDTARGANAVLSTDTTGASSTLANSLTAFSTTGFSLGNASPGPNFNGSTFASWAFRKQPKFFDVVTWTGNGANSTISHNLGAVPGFIIVKRTDTTSTWVAYHRGLTSAANYLKFNETGGQLSDSTMWNSTAPTATVFSLGTNSWVNANGGTYVAYIFAHDAGGFGLSGNDNVISCGSFTTDGSGNATATLGYEPQWVLLKNINAAATINWTVVDSLRGMPIGVSDAYVQANLSNAEAITSGASLVDPAPTGFSSTGLQGSNTYIYLAIRRPMKVPTDATKVFTSIARTGTGAAATLTTGFVTDAVLSSTRGAASTKMATFFDRLRGPLTYLSSTVNNGEATTPGATLTGFDNNTGFAVGAESTTVNNAMINRNTSTFVNWCLQRASGFFDLVGYTGTGVARTVTHNLGVVPELIITKSRSVAQDWQVYSGSLGNTQALVLNSTAATATDTTAWNNTTPTSSVFTVGTGSNVNKSNATYVAYLFATCPGVSKVGTYTGTGAAQTINCGFTGGARFVMIKRTDSTGDWYVWDTARGIISGNDPYLLMNSAAAEVTTTDYVSPQSSGFGLTASAPAALNASGGTYIYLAIA